MGFVAACGVGFPAAPKQGGPPWLELTSEHFTVWTDAEPARVRQLIRKLEDVRQVTAAIVYPTAPASGRALVIVLRNDQELSMVSNSGEPRAFAHGATGSLRQPAIVMSLTSTDHRTVAHEMTHLVSFSVIHHQPRWLAEGMAVFFESMRLDPGGAIVTLGAPSASYDRPRLLVPIRELFGWTGMSSNAMEVPLYDTAWALFAFLFNEHPTELARYLWLVDHAGDPATGTWQDRQRRAWDHGFPSLPFDAVDEALSEWLVHGSHLELRFHVQPRHWPVVARRLSDADAYAIRGYIRGGPTPAQEANERDELVAALAAEPLNVLAWTLKVENGETPTVDLARAIVSAHPEDWRAWWLMTRALDAGHGAPDELAAAGAKACALIARNPALVPPPGLCSAVADANSQ